MFRQKNCLILLLLLSSLAWSGPTVAWGANFTKLLSAIASNDQGAVEALAPHGSAINAIDRASGATPLTWASQRGVAPGIAAYLLSIGAEVERKDDEGYTPLTTAAMYGNVGVARLLLEKGANPNGVDRRNRTALIHAAGQDGRLEIVKLLLDKGAKVDGPAGRAACEAAQDWDHRDILLLLVGKGARPGYFRTVKKLLTAEPPPVKLFNRTRMP